MRTAALMAKPDLSKITATLDRFVSEADPEDLALMSMGAFAGWHGYTPLTALINTAGAGVDFLQDIKEKAKKGDSIAALEYGTAMGAINPMMGGPSTIAALLYPFFNPSYGDNIATSEKVEIKDAVVAHLCLACIGAIETYVITRPGTIAGIGEIVKGIGEIVPG